MNRHTRCGGVGGKKLLQGMSTCPQGVGWADTPAGPYGDLPNLQHGGDPLRYGPPVTHPLTKVTRKLT